MSADLSTDDLGVAALMPSSLSVEHGRRIAATLDDPRSFVPGDALPLLWHWAFFTPEAPTAQLGPDGHPRLSADGPMADLPRRMWAGGSVRWSQPLRLGEPAERRSHVGTVEEKVGRSGRLLIVTLHHRYLQGGTVCIDETQDLVYRAAPDAQRQPASAPAPPRAPAPGPAPERASAPARGDGSPAASETGAAAIDAALVVRHEIREPLLLRYSAITFNAHRIHYDRPYATAVEGYPGLVVHGPLLATLLTAAATEHAGGSTLASITYRGVAPATAPATVTIAIDPSEDDGAPALAGRAVRPDGTVAMHATFALRDAPTTAPEQER